MLILQVCGIPEDYNGNLRWQCENWLSRIAGRLDKGQLQYLEKLSLAAAWHIVYPGRILTRFMLLSLLPLNEILFSNENGFPFLAGNNVISFAYSNMMAVSAIFLSHADTTGIRLGIDIEPMNGKEKNKKFSTLRHLKNWLKFEIAIKASKFPPALSKMGEINPYRQEDYAPEIFYHKFIQVPGHIIGIGANLPFSKKINFMYMDSQKLATLGRGE